jgi:prophage maintenance system killer protein
MSRDKHPHKLLGTRERIQSNIDDVKNQERKGLIFQTALFLKNIAQSHIFASGNHRTAYAVAKNFMLKNGKRLKINEFEKAYPFIRNIETRNINEIQRWIKYGEK